VIKEPIASGQSNAENHTKWDNMEPSFQDDPRAYTEAELTADPAKRYHVNPADFALFATQKERGANWGDKEEKVALNDTLARYVQSTADIIAQLSGEDEDLPAADHIVYLDKSARPVSWFANVFWKNFSDKERPPHSYLAIDRMEWFARTKTKVTPNGYVENNDGSGQHIATYNDFKKENVSPEDIAGIRALFIPGGVETEDIDTIMKTPTGLDGKNITIVDEVMRGGATLEIAKYLISQAIPEAASVNGTYFWKGGFQISPENNSEVQMRSAPFWYDSNSQYGRGIGDVDENYYIERHKKYGTPKTRAQKLGSAVLGHPINLSQEPGGKSRELMREIKKLHEEWEAGHVFMYMPNHYDVDKWIDHMESQGIVFARQDGNKPQSKNTYTSIAQQIKQ